MVFVALLIMVMMQSFFISTDSPGIPDLKELRSWYEKPITEWPAPAVDSGVRWTEWSALPTPPIWENKDPKVMAMIDLGKKLFFDPRMSASRQISCSSCHDPDLHWADGRSKAIGVDHRQGRRHSISLQNVWAQKSFFWDGRVDDLAALAKHPLEDPLEMNTPIAVALQHINAIEGYKPFIKNAFAVEKLDELQLQKALAVFQQTIASNITRFDNFIKGRHRALSDQQVWGMHLFRTKARCFNCHNGPFFTDGEFHNLGFSNYGKVNQDLGRYVMTDAVADVGAFKTPGLRDVVRTFPWFHDGRFNEISMLLNQYNAGMPQPQATANLLNDPLYPKQSPLLKPLGISLDEREAIIRFLEAISAQPISFERPNLPN